MCFKWPPLSLAPLLLGCKMFLHFFMSVVQKVKDPATHHFFTLSHSASSSLYMLIVLLVRLVHVVPPDAVETSTGARHIATGKWSWTFSRTRTKTLTCPFNYNVGLYLSEEQSWRHIRTNTSAYPCLFSLNLTLNVQLYVLIAGHSVTMTTVDLLKVNEPSPSTMEVGGCSGSAPSPQSEAVTNELQELSLQPAPNVLPLQERKNGKTSTIRRSVPSSWPFHFWSCGARHSAGAHQHLVPLTAAPYKHPQYNVVTGLKVAPKKT